jgi:phage terminase large subunit-like protein
VLYEFPPEVQSDPAKPWRDPANWPLVTPNAGKSISIPRLLQACESEEQKGDAALRLWASQHLNIEIGIALHSDRWAGADFWQFCAAPEGMTLEQLIERSEVVVTGIDGGGLDDLLGFVALGRETGTGRWLAWSRAWAHRIVLERRKDIASQLLDFEKAHELVIVEKPGQDVEEVADLVEQIDAAGVLAEEAAVGVDQAGIDPIVNAIVDRKIKPERIVGVQQGWRLNGAIKTTERALAARTLLHGGSALLTWAVGNAKPEAHGNATVITKQRAGSAKIDPLMAEVVVKLVKSDEPGTLKDRLDEAWQSIKLGLVRGLSIGFTSKEHSYIEETYGIHFLKWNWLELSAVTIPANQEASITSIKSIDRQVLAASGLVQRSGVDLITQPPASRETKPAVRKRGPVQLIPRTYK